MRVETHQRWNDDDDDDESVRLESENMLISVTLFNITHQPCAQSFSRDEISIRQNYLRCECEKYPS